jgi:hemerythrin-like metal-binding protein
MNSNINTQEDVLKDFMPWSDALKVNIKSIDEQHKQLVDLINDLHKTLVNGESNYYMSFVLNELVDYTHYHFVTEEKLMAIVGYDDIENHKRGHKKLIWQIVDFQEKIKNGRTSLSMEIMDFLKDWLLKHINGTDKKYASTMHEHGIH